MNRNERIIARALSTQTRLYLTATLDTIADDRLTTEDIKVEVHRLLQAAGEVLDVLAPVDPAEVKRINRMFGVVYEKLNAYLLTQEPIDRETDAHNAQAEKETAAESATA